MGAVHTTCRTTKRYGVRHQSSKEQARSCIPFFASSGNHLHTTPFAKVRDQASPQPSKPRGCFRLAT